MIRTRALLLVFYPLLVLLLGGCSSADAIQNHTISPTSNSALNERLPTSTPSLDTEITNLLAIYEWTIKQQIAVHTITLPESFQHNAGDFPYAIYWAYNNEFNKDIGLNLIPYAGQIIQASIYSLNESLPEEFYPYTEARAVVIVFENKIIGAWIEKKAGFACSLDKKEFKEVVEQHWDEWLLLSGVVDKHNELDVELSTKTPEEIIEIYYTALNEHNYQLLNAVRSRKNTMRDLYVNKDELALFNRQEDTSMTLAIDNIENAQLLKTDKAGFSPDCFPVYAAKVDFQFVNPLIPTIPEGKILRFLVLNEEIEGLGWRIERINTAPGGSYEECAP